MTQVTVNGHVYSDDGSAARDMLNGGAKTWFLPLVFDAMVEADTAANAALANATNAATSAANAAASAASLSGTSTSSTGVGTGSRTFTTQAGKSFGNAAFLRIQRHSDSSVYLYGRSTAYDPATGALTVHVERVAGAGTFTDWDIFVTSMAGDTGPAGASAVAQRTITSADTVVANDNFKLLMLSGTFTLGFSAAATLGATFSVLLRNTSFGIVTLDPSGAETIEGASTMLLQPGQELWVTCDGTLLYALTINRGADGIMHVQDQKASGTNAGATTATTYHTRTLNTVVVNTIAGTSLSSNRVTLPAGIYEIEGRAQTCTSQGARLYLYSVTDSSYVLAGTSVYYISGGGDTIVRGQIQISGAKTFELRQYVVNADNYGLGNKVSAVGMPEIYAELFIRKVG